MDVVLIRLLANVTLRARWVLVRFVLCNIFVCALTLSILPALAGAEEPQQASTNTAQESAQTTVVDHAPPSADGGTDATNLGEDPCRQFDAQYDSWLDRNQVYVYRTVCASAAWFDGFFGDARYDQSTGETYGRVGVGSFWDQRNGVDSDLRLRARYALPSLRNRGAIIVGRGNEDELLEERTNSEQEVLPTNRTSVGGDSLYVGFGFRGFGLAEHGLDYSVGVKIRSSPELFAKATYRQSWQLTNKSQVRLRPILYWRSDEGVGSTLHLDYDYLMSDTMLFRWANFGNISEDPEIDGVDWGTTLSLFQALSKRRALTYNAFYRGEMKAEVRRKNYGFELRYRQRILREWLFVEYQGSLSWPRELLIEERKRNFGVGIRLEAFFGPTPEGLMR
jgi:hypothetical protein